MVSLTQAGIGRAAKDAVRQQAYTDGRGVRGLPVRLDGQDYPAHNADLSVVHDLIDGADALVWRGEELTIRHRHDVDQFIAVVRPGFDRASGDLVEIMGSPDLDWMLQLAETAAGADTRAGHGTAPVMSVVTCLSADCGLIGHPYPDRAEAQALSSVHDSVRHGGAVTAQAGTVARMCWEIDAPDGTALYRVADIELAEDLYQSAPVGSHLLPVMAMAGEY